MKDFEYKGFKFSDDKLTKFDASGANKAALHEVGQNLDGEKFAKGEKTVCDELLDKTSDISEIEDKMRGALLKHLGGTAGGLDAGEFSKELFMLFRNGEDTKDTLDNISISTQLTYISNTKDVVKAGQKVESDFNKDTKKILSDLDKCEKALVKTVPDKDKNSDENTLQSVRIQAVNRCYTLVKSAQGMVTTAIGAYLTALKDRNRQAKSICVAAMNYKPKNESTDLGGYSEGASLLDNVVLR